MGIRRVGGWGDGEEKWGWFLAFGERWSPAPDLHEVGS